MPRLLYPRCSIVPNGWQAYAELWGLLLLLEAAHAAPPTYGIAELMAEVEAQEEGQDREEEAVLPAAAKAAAPVT